MVRKPTRGQKVLDVFLTNCPHLWNPPNVFDGVVKTDHLAVIVTPRAAAKPERKISILGMQECLYLNIELKYVVRHWKRSIWTVLINS